MKKVAVVLGASLGTVAVACVIWLVVAALSGIGIAAFWNWMGLHSYFGMDSLNFWQCIGAGAAVSTLDQIFSSNDNGDRLKETITNVRDK